jgi:exodeoxyribonuclease-3
MAFRKKAELLLKRQPDIVIVPECEHPDKFNAQPAMVKPKQSLWFGDNPHKGLGVFSYSGYQFRLLKKYDPALRFVVPIRVTGKDIQFTLFAIWANNPADKQGRYVEQVWKAVNYYKDELKKSPCILAGDFNSNTIWDKEHKEKGHSNVVSLLKEKNILSVYHLHHHQEQGKEKDPTFHLYKQRARPYHLDYCFASKEFTQRIKSVEIGKHKQWTKHSDHLPVIVEFEF